MIKCRLTSRCGSVTFSYHRKLLPRHRRRFSMPWNQFSMNAAEKRVIFADAAGDFFSSSLKTFLIELKWYLRSTFGKQAAYRNQLTTFRITLGLCDRVWSKMTCKREIRQLEMWKCVNLNPDHLKNEMLPTHSKKIQFESWQKYSNQKSDLVMSSCASLAQKLQCCCYFVKPAVTTFKTVYGHATRPLLTVQDFSRVGGDTLRQLLVLVTVFFTIHKYSMVRLLY